MSPEMYEKDANIAHIASSALKDDALLSELLEGLRSKKETFRYNCHKVLMLISEGHGQVLYPKWDYLVEQLSSDNTYWKMSALQILANLTSVDGEGKFEQIFDKYYGLLDDKSMITAAHVAGASSKIVKSKPELEMKITARLLNLDGTHHEPERRDLVKGYAIEAFSEYFDQAKDKEGIIKFVEQQVDAKSPRTRKIAGDFLRRWGG